MPTRSLAGVLGGVAWPLFVATAMAAAPEPAFEHHPDIRLELFAQEPQVIDPVAVAFGAGGEAYVVEMRDYPYGFGPERKPGGTVRLLRDRDGDGRADEAHLFAEGLSFPTSVTPWRGGMLVAAPPRVIYLEDTDGDDRADLRRTVLEGFTLGVTDSNMNGLRWGPDCRVHGANGGAGGTVSSPLSRAAPVRLAQHDFAFDPDTGALGLTARTGGGFGLVFDTWGHSFTTYNINYLQQRIIARRYLQNNPALRGVKGTANISAHGEWARLYPIVRAQTRVNHPEQAGHFSSAGGMGLLEPGGFPGRLGEATSIFVCDVVTNVVHRDLLHERGPVFLGRRAPEEERSEFIASRDPDFRPVGMEDGPDGALYLVDMQRSVIEHPDYIPAVVLAKMEVRAGEDRGRIYRVVPAAGLPAAGPPLKGAGAAELVAALGSPLRWRASTAQRLLFESWSPQRGAALMAAWKGGLPPRARVRALWLLAAAGADRAGGTFPWAEVEAALADPHPGVRENGLLVSERAPPPAAVVERILALAADPHPRVRFQAALSSGRLDHPGKVAALAALLARDGGEAWTRRAVWTAVPGRAWALLRQLVGPGAVILADERLSAARPALLGELAELATREAPEDPEREGYPWLARLPLAQWPAADAAGFLEGLARGWRENPPPPAQAGAVAACLDTWGERLAGAAAVQLIELHTLAGQPLSPALERAWSEAAEKARDARLPGADRLRALELVAAAPGDRSEAVLLEHLGPLAPGFLQEAALEALGRRTPDGLAGQLLARWRGLSPSYRPRLIQLLISRAAYRKALLDALDAGAVTVQELNLDLEQRRTLLRWSSPLIAVRARKYFGDEEYSNRRAIVDEWLEKLPASGDPSAGRAVFAQHCAICHRAGDLGHVVGPDLTALSHRSVEDLLSHILDPNMAINPNYVTCRVETEGGDIYTGLLAEETATHLTLKLQLGHLQRVGRSALVRKEMLPASLMPEGIEQLVDPRQMRDLIAFLQQGAAAAAE